jgi:hypothetical protein
VSEIKTPGFLVANKHDHWSYHCRLCPFVAGGPNRLLGKRKGLTIVQAREAGDVHQLAEPG